MMEGRRKRKEEEEEEEAISIFMVSILKLYLLE